MSETAVMEAKSKTACEDEVRAEAICDAKDQQSEITTEQDRIVKHIMCKLTAFDAAVKASKLLEIDGVAIDGNACD